MAIAYFHTWTTYGTWLPGDERGWFDNHGLFHVADSLRNLEAHLSMSESPVILAQPQRKLVEDTIRRHCAIRNWLLHAVNCRSNHVHVVLTATGYDLKEPRRQLKSWSTRGLRPTEPTRLTWWTEKGWDVYIDDESQLLQVMEYVENQ